MPRLRDLSTGALLAGLVYASAALSADIAADQPALTAASVSAASAELAPEPTWAVRFPTPDFVRYRGVANMDGAGVDGGNILYPAPNLVGLVAAVVTHGLLIDSAKTRQKEALQKAVDDELLPYAAITQSYTSDELFTQALARTRTTGGTALTGDTPLPRTLLEISPEFLISRDQRAIVLNGVVVVSAGVTAAPAPLNLRVISDAWPSSGRGQPIDYWSEEEGARLKAESALLLARAIDIALATRADDDIATKPFKTFRYQEGLTERMERGQLVSERCGRIVMKNLRGILISAPATAGKLETDVCD